jgi:hypothetical protein
MLWHQYIAEFIKLYYRFAVPLKLALASLTGGDRSIGIVRLRTKTTEYVHCYASLFVHFFYSTLDTVKFVRRRPVMVPVTLAARSKA